MKLRRTRGRGTAHDTRVEARRQYELLTEQAQHTSAELGTAAGPVMRASVMAALAGLEESIAMLHELSFPVDAQVPAGDVPLLKFIAATEDAPAAERFFARLSPKALAPSADSDLIRITWPFLQKLAASSNSKTRADLLSALAAELLPVVGATAAETVSWLADLAAERAAAGAGM